MDITGRVEANLWSNMLNKGVQTLNFDVPQNVKTGIYILRIKQGNFVQYEKLMVSR
jgi:hypothetical protein